MKVSDHAAEARRDGVTETTDHPTPNSNKRRMVLAAALEDVVRLVEGADRFRKVALPPYTDPYARLTISEGFARIGSVDRASQLRRDAMKTLGAEASDPIHGYLIYAYDARIDQAAKSLPRDTALPGQIIAHLESLDRVDRYKVDRLREQSPILASDIPSEAKHPNCDALGTFVRRLVRPPNQARNPTLDALRGIADTAEAATTIEKLVDEELVRAIFLESACERLGTCLDMLLELPEHDAMPVVARVIFAVDRLKPAIPAILCAKLVRVAARFGYGELIPAMVRELVNAIRRGASLDTLAITIKALRRLGMMEELDQILRDVENDPDCAVAMVVAGARAYLGDPRGAAHFDAKQRILRLRKIGTRRMLDLARDIGTGASHADLCTGVSHVIRLGECLGAANDSFSTNTHFSLSFLHLVESIVLATADLDLADAGIRDPIDRALLPLRPALDSCGLDTTRTNEGQLC